MNAIDFNDLFLSTHAHVQQLTKQFTAVSFHRIDEKQLVKNNPSFRRANTTSLIELKDSIKNIAVINGLGTGIGDTIVGMSALKLFIKKYKLKHVVWHFYLRPDMYAKLAELYLSQLPNSKLHILPVRAATLSEYDYFLDFSRLTEDESFSNVNLFDFYLQRFGINFDTICGSEKRILFKTSNEKLVQAKNLIDKQAKESKTIFLSFDTTSPIRSIPSKYREVIVSFLSQQGYTLLADKRFGEYPDSVFDTSKYSQSLIDFGALIKNCNFVISADTATCHFADAFDTKTLSIFTTISPDLRTQYYPNNKSMLIPDAERHRLWGMHRRPKDFKLSELSELWQNVTPTFLIDQLNLFLNDCF